MDSQIAVTAVWKKNGLMLSTSATRMLSDVILVSNFSLYLAVLTFNPIQLSNDDGVYACEVTVSAQLDDFVTNTGVQSENVSLLAAGMFITKTRSIP